MKRVLLIALLITPSLITAEDNDGDDEVWIRVPPLYLGCAATGVSFEASVFRNEADNFGLTTHRLETIIETKLRGANIYRKGNNSDKLSVNVDVVGNAFSVRVDFSRPVVSAVQAHVRVWEAITNDAWRDTPKPLNLQRSLYENQMRGTVWTKSSVGTYGKDSGAALVEDAVEEHVDEFVLAYLKAREFEPECPK